MHTKAIRLCSATIILTLMSCGNDSIREITVSENTEADFGIIKEKDGPAEALLLLPNTYQDTLIPVAALTRCSCVRARMESTSAAPGETLKVAVTYNPSYRSGIFMEEIGIRCLGRKGILSLIIKGEVKPMRHAVEEDYPYLYGKGLHMSHETLHFGKLSPGERKGMFVRCANSGRKKMDLSFDIPREYSGCVSFSESHKIGGRGKDTVWFHFTMPGKTIAGDTLTFPLIPLVNGKPADKELEIKAIYNAAY